MPRASALKNDSDDTRAALFMLASGRLVRGGRDVIVEVVRGLRESVREKTRVH